MSFFSSARQKQQPVACTFLFCLVSIALKAFRFLVCVFCVFPGFFVVSCRVLLCSPAARCSLHTFLRLHRYPGLVPCVSPTHYPHLCFSSCTSSSRYSGPVLLLVSSTKLPPLPSRCICAHCSLQHITKLSELFPHSAQSCTHVCVMIFFIFNVNDVINWVCAVVLGIFGPITSSLLCSVAE